MGDGDMPIHYCSIDSWEGYMLDKQRLSIRAEIERMVYTHKVTPEVSQRVGTVILHLVRYMHDVCYKSTRPHDIMIKVSVSSDGTCYVTLYGPGPNAKPGVAEKMMRIDV